MRKSILGKFVLVVFSFIILVSCATGSVIVTGNVRPEISPTEVKIYSEAPLKYETIALLEASADVEITRQMAQDLVMDKLKSQAAKIGANGVLLTATGSQASGSSGYVSGNFFYSEVNDKIVAQAKAIFVTQD